MLLSTGIKSLPLEKSLFYSSIRLSWYCYGLARLGDYEGGNFKSLRVRGNNSNNNMWFIFINFWRGISDFNLCPGLQRTSPSRGLDCQYRKKYLCVSIGLLHVLLLFSFPERGRHSLFCTTPSMTLQYSTPKVIHLEHQWAEQFMFASPFESLPFNSHDRQSSTDILEPSSTTAEIIET